MPAFSATLAPTPSAAVRQATPEDVQHVVELGAKFHAYSTWSDIPYDREVMTAFMSGVIENGAIFLTDTGMCGGVLMPVYFNPAYMIGMELFWYAPDGDQGLRRAFEDWSEERGVYAIQFCAMGDDHLPALKRIYGRSGYVVAETAFLKRVG